MEGENENKGTDPFEGTKSESTLVAFLLNVVSKVLTQTIVQKSPLVTAEQIFRSQ